MAVNPITIAVALGRATPEPGSVTEQQWQMWIDDAHMLIDARRVELSVDSVSAIATEYVIREAVVAQVRRPDDATQVTVSVDDASTSRTYSSGRGRVKILDEWWTLLGLAKPGGGAFSVDMVGGVRPVHLSWCDRNFGGADCSCGASLAGFPIYEGGLDAF